MVATSSTLTCPWRSIILIPSGKRRPQRAGGCSGSPAAPTRGGQQTALFYFQGAGLTAWWAFQWHVVEKNREEGVPFYLVVGMQKNSVAEYWFHRLGETEIWENRKHLTRATLEHNGFERQQAAGGIL